MDWKVIDNIYDKKNIALNGNKFIIGNGYMGYRGTLDEYDKEQMVCCHLAGLYDRAGKGWREPVNAPNALSTKLFCNDELISILSCSHEFHQQSLDISCGIHERKTIFTAKNKSRIHVKSERFLDNEDRHLICMKYSFKVQKKSNLVIETGIDGDVWDINGPHLKDHKATIFDNIIQLNARTSETGILVSISESIYLKFGHQDIKISDKSIKRIIILDAQPDMEYVFFKFVTIYTGNDYIDVSKKTYLKSCYNISPEHYDDILVRNKIIWEKIWKRSDVIIKGDKYIQFALRFSIYNLLIIAPVHSDSISIPARGLSGQVYKGAVFWDTEIFMLPFFILTDPATVKNILKYRYHGLSGARKKAKEYGYKGAFYAWESQDNGYEACTEFNVVDIFTERPMRTYFRDRQIHISADVVYGLWQYYLATGDENFLVESASEIILECARFFYSYSYFKKDKNRYEILDVTGPDEYHERVNNNAFTNMMIKYSLEVAIKTLELLKNNYKKKYDELMEKLDFKKDIENIIDMYELLYVPEPGDIDLVIPQFDNYNKLENISLSEIKERMKDPYEYLGGGNGLATTTQIIKQADIVLMLSLFNEKYDKKIKKSNFDYYEPRTEHGSSLSHSAHSILASECGYFDLAYKYFIKTVSIDLAGDAKQYVGTLYIGGTHPAASGGSWMSVIFGFCGIRINEDHVKINPSLPEKIKYIEFNFIVKNQQFKIIIDRERIKIISSSGNTTSWVFKINDKDHVCGQNSEISVKYLLK